MDTGSCSKVSFINETPEFILQLTFAFYPSPTTKKDSPQAAFVCYNILGATKTVGGRFLAPERGRCLWNCTIFYR